MPNVTSVAMLLFFIFKENEGADSLQSSLMKQLEQFLGHRDTILQSWQKSLEKASWIRLEFV